MKIVYRLAAVLLVFGFVEIRSLEAQPVEDPDAPRVLVAAISLVRDSLPVRGGLVAIEAAEFRPLHYAPVVAALMQLPQVRFRQVVQCRSRELYVRNEVPPSVPPCHLEGTGLDAIITVSKLELDGNTAEVILEVRRHHTSRSGWSWVAWQEVLLRLTRDGGSWSVTEKRLLRVG